MNECRNLSYEEIVHHIVNDTPVPNVVEVPDVTLSESMRSASEMKPRPKPWELDRDDRQVETDAKVAGGDDSAKGIEESDLTTPVSYESVSKYYAMAEELDEALKNQ